METRDNSILGEPEREVRIVEEREDGLPRVFSLARQFAVIRIFWETVWAECEKVVMQCAADNIDHLGFLFQVVDLELIEQDRKAGQRRLKSAPFPAPKTLDEFDFAARPSINCSTSSAATILPNGKTSCPSDRAERGKLLIPRPWLYAVSSGLRRIFCFGKANFCIRESCIRFVQFFG